VCCPVRGPPTTPCDSEARAARKQRFTYGALLLASRFWLVPALRLIRNHELQAIDATLVRQRTPPVVASPCGGAQQHPAYLHFKVVVSTDRL